MKERGYQILIIDLGSQYTEIIRRSLRYLGYRSIIVSPENCMEHIKKTAQLRGIILSGGSASVYDTDAPVISEDVLFSGVPLLGVCLGMQWIAYINSRDSVEAVRSGKSYGPVEVSLGKSRLFAGLPEKIKAWSSHGDSVKKVPGDFTLIDT